MLNPRNNKGLDRILSELKTVIYALSHIAIAKTSQGEDLRRCHQKLFLAQAIEAISCRFPLLCRLKSNF